MHCFLFHTFECTYNVLTINLYNEQGEGVHNILKYMNYIQVFFSNSPLYLLGIEPLTKGSTNT